LCGVNRRREALPVFDDLASRNSIDPGLQRRRVPTMAVLRIGEAMNGIADGVAVFEIP
jgi:hypothetical protein